MNVTSAQYKIHKDGIQNIIATIDEVSVFVPIDPANRHYAEIMRQVEAGSLTIQEAD